MTILKEETIASLEQTIQRRIEYDSISPSVLLYLEARDVRIAGFKPDERENLYIGKVRIYYHFGRLIQGDMEGAIREIRLINSTFNLNQSRDRQLFELVSELGGTKETASWSALENKLPKNMSLVGENITVEYSTEEHHYSLSRLFFTLQFKEESTDLHIEGTGGLHFLSPLIISEISLEEASSAFELDGRFRKPQNEISGRIQLEEFTSNLIDFKRLTLEMISTEEKIVLRKIEDRSPYDFFFEYSPSSKVIKANFAAEEFIPRNNLAPKDDFRSYSPWLNSVISGEAELELDILNDKLDYQGDLRVVLDNELLPFPMDLELRGSGNREYFICDRFAIQSKQLRGSFKGRVFFQQPFAVGNFDINRFVFSKDNVLSAKVSLEGSREQFILSSERLSIGDVAIEEIKAEGSVTNEEAGFNLQARYRAPEDRDAGPNILADGTFAFGKNRYLELSLNSQTLPLSPILQEFIPQEYIAAVNPGQLFLHTEAYFNTNFERYSFSLLPLKIVDEQGIQLLASNVNGNNERIQLNNISLQVGEYAAGGNIDIVQNQEGKLTFNSSLTVNSVYYELQGIYYQPATLIVRGNHGLSLNLLNRPGYTAFSVQTRDLPMPLADGQISELSMLGRGTIRSRREWSIQLPDFSLTNIPGFPEDSLIELSGTFRPGHFNLNRLSYSDPISAISGSGQGYFESLDPFEGNVQVSLSDENNMELYSLTGSYTGSQVTADISLNNAPLSRIRSVPLDGLLSGTVTMRGPVDDPELRYTVKIDEGEYQQNIIRIESEGSFIDQVINVDYLHAEYNSHILQRGAGSLNLKSGQLELDGQYRGIFFKNQSSAEVSLQGQFVQNEEPLGLLQLSQTPFRAQADLENIRMFDKQQEDWSVLLQRSSDAFVFEGGPNRAMEGYFGEEGEFNFSLSDPLPVRFTASGNYLEEDFGVKIENILIKAEFLSMLGVQVVDFSSGEVTGSLEISGAPNDPFFQGDMRVNSFAGRVMYVDGDVQPFNTKISLNDKTAVVQPVVLRVEDRFAELSGGFSFERWNLETIDVYVRTLSADGIPVLYQDPGSGLNVDGYAVGTFQYELRPGRGRISGDLTANNCVINLEDREERLIRTRGNPIVVDLKIHTGRRVEFLWPRKNFPIIQAFADTGQSISVYFDNITDSFQLKGKMDLKSGEMYYFQRSFYIKEGSITFNENEDKFDPLLSVEAQIKEIDTSGSPVTISLLVDNEPLSSFTPRFESNPTLSTTEIASILGTNLYSQFDQNQGELTSALLITGDLFSQFSIMRSFEQQMKDMFNLDLFSIRTQMIQNVILERVLNQNIAQDPESDGTVGRYLDNTTLFLGKYLGNDLFLETLVQIQQDPIETGEFGQNELNLSMELGLEWKTPFFLLNLSVSPDFEEPLNSLENTSLGFSWDFSY